MTEWTGREIAIVGMAGRFPGARDLEELWRNLRSGVEGIVRFSDHELRDAGVDPSDLSDPSYVKAGSPLDGVDLFDAGFFGYSAREAELLDPQQRLFLETVWQALEDAGYRAGGYPGLIGVYAGAAWNTYLLSNLTTRPDLFAGAGGFQVFTASDKDFLPTRVSYKLDLRGPSVLVQTSCSTSLVATHLACLSLLNYECDLAVAGGVTVKVPQMAGYFHEDGSLASPDGRCRPFDARAAGTVFGSGVGAVVLKRLDEALADGDTIRALVLGSAINNDGSHKVSYTAPSVEGQAEVIAGAQAVAGVDPSTVEYVETHGTGTSLGDPIEVAALTKAFAAGGPRERPCALGSVKSNLGHLDAAAGVAGLIKTTLALEHGEVPPSLHYERPNPALDLDAGSFAVAAELLPWPRRETPRRAGVSSFGVGGTNAHLVLEEAPEAVAGDRPRPGHLMVLSARTEAALAAASDALREHLSERVGDAPEELADVAFTLQAGRTVFRHRRALVCRDRAEAVALLSGAEPERVRRAVDDDDPRPRPVAFLFAGEGGPGSPGVRALAAEEPAFGEALERYLALLGADDRAPGGAGAVAVELALAELWRGWGIEPCAVLGRGAGELSAAAVAGALEPAEALRRARSLPAGAAPEPVEPSRPPRVPVLSGDRLGELLAEPERALLEVGVGSALATEARRHPDRGSRPVATSLAGRPGAPDGDRTSLLEGLGELWLGGVEVDWERVYRGERRRRVPLPTYPFERRRYWIEAAPRGAAPGSRSALTRRPDPGDWLYLPAWRPALPPPVSTPRRWLLLAPDGGRSRALAGRLAARGHEVTLATPGDRFTPQGDDRFRVAPGSADDLRALLEAQEAPPEVVVHAWTLEGAGAEEPSVASFEGAQETGFLALLALGRALTGGGTGEGTGEGTSLLVLSHGLDGPGAAVPLRTGLAPMLGLLRVLPQELPGLRCRAVDVPAGAGAGEMAEALVREAADGSPAAAVAYRGGERWVEGYQGVPLPAPPEGEDEALSLRPGAAYLVTGGLAGVGLEVARHLTRRLTRPLTRLGARAARPRLVLLEEEAPGEAGARADALRELRELAEAVDLHVAPAGDGAGVARAVSAANDAPDGLRGVVHAAGPTDLASFRLLAEADPESCRPHFEGRVHRLLELDAVLGRGQNGSPGRDLDFAWAVSSLASVVGGPGNAAYAASNRYLEAFARDRAARGGTPRWTAVAWDALGASGEGGGFAGRRAEVAGLALSSEECGEVVRRLLATPAVPRMLISTGDLEARIEAARRLAHRRAGAVEVREDGEPAERHPRPELPVAYAPPEGELEEVVAEVWGQVLGFERIGVHDNFFDLGGDSFLATRLAARLRDDLGVDLPVARLYEGTTVRTLARLVAEEGDGAPGRSELLEERRESGRRRKEVLRQRREARRHAEGVT